MNGIKLSTITLEENCYTKGDKVYKVTDLIKLSKDLEPFDLPLIGIELDVNPWSSCSNALEFAKHMKRVLKADLKYPIILDNTGFICDGWHRVVKAIIEGKKTIKAVRLTTMPEPK